MRIAIGLVLLAVTVPALASPPNLLPYQVHAAAKPVKPAPASPPVVWKTQKPSASSPVSKHAVAAPGAPGVAAATPAASGTTPPTAPDAGRAVSTASVVPAPPTAPPVRHNLPTCNPVRGGNLHWCIPTRRSRMWTLHPGQSIRATMDKWAKRSGWTVEWEAKNSPTVPAFTTIHGQFEQAATWVFRQLASDGVLLRVRFYEGNSLLLVQGVSG